MNNNSKTNKDQSNKAIKNEPAFDTNIFNLSSGNSNPLPVVTVSLLEVKKHRAKTVSGLTCLWDSGDTDSTIKRKRTKQYDLKIRSNKVEYSTATGMYCTTHDVKLPFGMPEFSTRKIINHRFHFENDKVESGICYDTIIGRDLMVQLGLTANFKRQLLQWDGNTVHMKEPISLLGISGLAKRYMCKVVIQTAEPSSTREANEQIVKVLGSTYAKLDLNQVANNTTHLNAE